MDTQIATTPRGFLHAVNSVQSEQDARRFRAVMEHQGFTVVHLSSVAAAARFARPTRPTSAPERPAQDALPALGTRVQFKVDQELRTGSVAAVLRWPTDHPHCSGRVALLVRSPGWKGLVEPQTALPVTEVMQQRASPPPPQVPALTHFLPAQPGAWVQPGLW